MFDFDFDKMQPAITAASDQAKAALNEMPADVLMLLCQHYSDEALSTLAQMFTQLLPHLQHVMTEQGFAGLSYDAVTTMRCVAMSCFILNFRNDGTWRSLATDSDDKQLDEDKAAVMVELLETWSDKLESAFKLTDS